MAKAPLEIEALQRPGEGVFQTLFSEQHLTSESHGQPQKETPPPDEQAQAQEALESQSSQEAHLAEVRRARAAGYFSAKAADHLVGGFFTFGWTGMICKMSCQLRGLRDGPKLRMTIVLASSSAGRVRI